MPGCNVGTPGAGGRIYNVTATDIGGEASDPAIWPAPKGGADVPPVGTQAIMEGRSFTGPHVSALLGSERG